MKDYIIFGIRNFLGIEEDLTTILQNQEHIIEKLEGLEITSEKALQTTDEVKASNYFQYITFANAFYTFVGISLIASGIWLYHADILNHSVLESIKALGNLSKDLHQIDNKSVLEALKVLNENNVELNGEQLKKITEILHYTQIIKSIVDKNPHGEKLIEELLVPKDKGGLVFFN